MNCLQVFAPAMEFVIHIFFWYIWKERNDRIFNEVSNSSSVIFRKMWFTMLDWMMASGCVLSSSAAVWKRVLFDNG
ncbi:hypothetical protein LINPERPRIM_LOCUS3814 [Linum perenne]